MIVYFLISFAAMSAILSFLNWKFSDKSSKALKDCSENFSIFTGLWTVTLLLIVDILLHWGF